jgi:hypothetical protein
LGGPVDAVAAISLHRQLHLTPDQERRILTDLTR